MFGVAAIQDSQKFLVPPYSPGKCSCNREKCPFSRCLCQVRGRDTDTVPALRELLVGSSGQANKCFQFCAINKCCDEVSSGTRKRTWQRATRLPDLEWPLN